MHDCPSSAARPVEMLSIAFICFAGPVVLASEKQQGDGWIPHANYLLLAGLTPQY